MKILVVDDHALIRDAMRGVLVELEPSATVVEADTAAMALACLADHPDVGLVLLDLKLPDRDGVEALREMRTQYPATAVVMLSAFNDRENILRSLDAGAQGFIPKTQPRNVLLGALQLVLAGGLYIPPDAIRGGGLPSDGSTHSAAPLADTMTVTPAELGLTGRQLDVLALMMQGQSNKHICRALDLAEPTVKNHVSAILRALGVSNRTEAVMSVAARGWQLPLVKK